MEITPLLLLYPTIHHNKQIIKNHRKNVSQDKMNRNINAKEKYRRNDQTRAARFSIPRISIEVESPTNRHDA